MKVINSRCPFQGECERKSCGYVGKELKCSYYDGNSRPGYEIDDQEEIRRRAFDESAFDAFEDIEDIPDVDQLANTGKLVMIPTSKIRHHPDNPRKDIGDVSELAESIKVNGILQNLMVVPYDDPLGIYEYTVIIGHRRLEASKEAGLNEVPCVIVELSERSQISVMLNENIQRNDLTVYEQAQGFQMMLDLGSTVEDVAKESGFSKTTVRRRMKLLELDKGKFKAAEERGATLTDYMALDKISDIELKNKVLDSIGTKDFSVNLQAAIDLENRRKKTADIVEKLSAFATQVESVENCQVAFVKTYGTWFSANAEVEVPEDASTEQYFFIVRVKPSYTEIPLYKQYIPSDEEIAAKEAAAAEKQHLNALADARDAAGKEISKRAYHSRMGFIKDFSGAKHHLAEITELLGTKVIEADYYDSINPEILAEVLEIELDRENEFPMEAFAEKVRLSPEYALLALAYSYYENSSMSYHYKKWDNAKDCNTIQYRTLDSLDTLYTFLEKLGYQISEEENAMINGTHEIFKEDEENE